MPITRTLPLSKEEFESILTRVLLRNVITYDESQYLFLGFLDDNPSFRFSVSGDCLITLDKKYSYGSLVHETCHFLMHASGLADKLQLLKEEIFCNVAGWLLDVTYMDTEDYNTSRLPWEKSLDTFNFKELLFKVSLFNNKISEQRLYRIARRYHQFLVSSKGLKWLLMIDRVAKDIEVSFNSTRYSPTVGTWLRCIELFQFAFKS